MRKCLIAMIIINLLGGVLGSFALLAQNILLGVLGFVGTALSVVPYIALLQAMDDIEDLRASVQVLQGRIYQMRQAVDTVPEVKTALDKQVSRHVWSCPRCGAVNKAGTHECESCGARYESA